MVSTFKKENGNYLAPFALPGENGKMTEEEAQYAETFIEGMKAQYPDAFVDIVKWGWMTFPAVVVKGDKQLFDFAIRDLDAAIKREAYDRRCIVPDKKEGIKHCPERIPNPAFDRTRPVGKENPKTIKNSCDGCPFNTFDRPSYATQSIEGLTRVDDEGNEIPFEIAAPMQAESDRYIKACDALLGFVAKNYPKKLKEIAMRLDGDNRKQIAEKLGKSKSSSYALGKRLTDALYDFLDTLWYIDINRRRR